MTTSLTDEIPTSVPPIVFDLFNGSQLAKMKKSIPHMTLP